MKQGPILRIGKYVDKQALLWGCVIIVNTNQLMFIVGRMEHGVFSTICTLAAVLYEIEANQS